MVAFISLLMYKYLIVIELLILRENIIFRLKQRAYSLIWTPPTCQCHLRLNRAASLLELHEAILLAWNSLLVPLGQLTLAHHVSSSLISNFSKQPTPTLSSPSPTIRSSTPPSLLPGTSHL